MNTFSFKIIHQSRKSRARVGHIKTAHGVIDTPNFVTVGTNGTIKAIDSSLIQSLGLQLMFCNTYHLILQPGADIIEQCGGIHAFSNCSIPIITDSGGFQVFSLRYGSVHEELKSKGTKKNENSVLKITEDGVLFRSYRDGTPVLLTPETSIQAQKKIGADIIVSFDELPPYHTTPKKLFYSLERTHRWEQRSLEEHKKNPKHQGLYAVIHGGLDVELRKKSCGFLGNLPFDGYGIGGSLGKTRDDMVTMLQHVMPYVPTDRPNHLLGIGDIPSLEQCVPLGIDTFDSSHPTKAARHGLLFTKKGPMRLVKSGHATLQRPIEDDCTCMTCQKYTVAYLCHLFKAHEMTVLTLASIHNLHFMVNLMKDFREKILNDAV